MRRDLNILHISLAFDCGFISTTCFTQDTLHMIFFSFFYCKASKQKSFVDVESQNQFSFPSQVCAYGIENLTKVKRVFLWTLLWLKTPQKNKKTAKKTKVQLVGEEKIYLWSQENNKI